MKQPEIQYLSFPKMEDKRGNLSFIEGGRHLPFSMKQARWIYDIPSGEKGDGYASRGQHECIIALSGSFDLVLYDGICEHRYTLNRPFCGIYIPPMNWYRLENFSTNLVVLSLTSSHTDREDHITRLDDFLREKDLFSPATLPVQPIVSSPKQMADICSYKLADCSLLDLSRHHDRASSSTEIKDWVDLPFALQRVYYTYDIPADAVRGGHAHRVLKQYLIAVAGSFDVWLDDGDERKCVHLNRPYQALLIVPGIWRELTNFSSGSVCLVLASEYYQEEDYIRDYERFKQLKYADITL